MFLGDNTPLLRTFIRLWSPFVSRPHPDYFYNMTISNAAGFSVESFFSSIDSLRRTDLSDQMHNIQIPAMGIYGARDVIVSPQQIKLFRRLLPHGKDVWIQKAGHFPMWDTPDEFNEAFREFMALEA
ncbi:MAG: alpha/beta hydrolase [Chloroflexi bacterium]|nr:alpha/beta hydrolase [Chloroflexota bacterium]